MSPNRASCFISILCISFNLVFFFILCFFFISSLESFSLVHLERSPPSPHTSSCVREYLLQSQEHIEMLLVDRKESSPPSTLHHPTHPPLHPPPPPLHRDLCCLDRCEWRSSCGWLRAKHIASLPRQFKYWSTALLCFLCLSYVYSCVDKWHRRLLRYTDTTAHLHACMCVCMHLLGYICLQHAFICVCLWGLYVNRRDLWLQGVIIINILMVDADLLKMRLWLQGYTSVIDRQQVTPTEACEWAVPDMGFKNENKITNNCRI